MEVKYTKTALQRMRVADLRKLAIDNEVNVDGTKPVLLSRLYPILCKETMQGTTKKVDMSEAPDVLPEYNTIVEALTVMGMNETPDDPEIKEADLHLTTSLEFKEPVPLKYGTILKALKATGIHETSYQMIKGELINYPELSDAVWVTRFVFDSDGVILCTSIQVENTCTTTSMQVQDNGTKTMNYISWDPMLSVLSKLCYRISCIMHKLHVDPSTLWSVYDNIDPNEAYWSELAFI